MAAPPRLVVPTPQTASTIGTLNIIFGSVLFLYSFSTLTSLLMAPLIQTPVKAMTEAYKDLARQDQEKILAAVQALAEAAETEEEKEVYRARIEEIRATEAKPPASLGLMTMGFDDWTIIGWSWLDSSTSMLANLAMVLAGAGLIASKEWGRRLGSWTGWAKIARLILVWGIVWIGFVVPPMSAKLGKGVEEMIMQQQGGAGALPVSFTTIYAITYSAMGVFMVIAGAVYPIICVIALNKPGVRAACVEPKPAAGPEL